MPNKTDNSSHQLCWFVSQDSSNGVYPTFNGSTTKESRTRDLVCCVCQLRVDPNANHEMTKLAVSSFLFEWSIRQNLPQTTNQGRTNSNSQPEKGFNSKGAKIARFGADLPSRKSVFAGYERVLPSKSATYLPTL